MEELQTAMAEERATKRPRLATSSASSADADPSPMQILRSLPKEDSQTKVSKWLRRLQPGAISRADVQGAAPLKPISQDDLRFNVGHPFTVAVGDRITVSRGLAQAAIVRKTKLHTTPTLSTYKVHYTNVNTNLRDEWVAYSELLWYGWEGASR